MKFCPKCGGDRAQVAQTARCPVCGGPGLYELAELGPGTPPAVAAPMPTVHAPPLDAPAPAPAYAAPPPGNVPMPDWYPPPIRPRPFAIAFGAALVVLSLWLLFSFLPSKRPMNEVEATAYVLRETTRGNVAAIHEWRLNPKIYPYTYIVAALLGIWGVTGIVRGASYRPPLRRQP